MNSFDLGLENYEESQIQLSSQGSFGNYTYNGSMPNYVA